MKAFVVKRCCIPGWTAVDDDDFDYMNANLIVNIFDDEKDAYMKCYDCNLQLILHNCIGKQRYHNTKSVALSNKNGKHDNDETYCTSDHFTRHEVKLNLWSWTSCHIRNLHRDPNVCTYCNQVHNKREDFDDSYQDEIKDFVDINENDDLRKIFELNDKAIDFLLKGNVDKYVSFYCDVQEM